MTFRFYIESEQIHVFHSFLRFAKCQMKRRQKVINITKSKGTTCYNVFSRRLQEK